MYKLYTHNDLDGLGCAILANIAFKNDIDIEYCNSPEEVSTRLLEAYKDKTAFDYNAIYITDCSILASSEVLEYVQKHKNVRLFDHHKTALYLNEYSWAKVAVDLNGKLTCGTELFYQFLMYKGLLTNRDFFVEQVRLFDTWDWAKTSSKLPKYLSDLVYILGLSEFVSVFTDRLKKHDISELTIFNQYERDLLEYDSKRLEDDIKRKVKLAKTVMIDNEKYIVSFADKNQSALGNTLCNTFPDAKCVIMFNMDKGMISFRSIGDNDCSAIAQLYSGGGHKNASGGKIDEKSMETVIGFLMNNIGKVDEIHTVVDE